MSELRNKFQDIGRRAAQFKQALDAAPARVAQVREAVLQARGQVQQLRREVQASVVSLQAPDGDRLALVLAELVGNAETLRAAGYELAGVEYELDPVQRAFLLLDKTEDVPSGQLQSLQAAQVTQPALHGLLGAMARAESLAVSLTLPDQEFWRLRVEVGPAPAVRLYWRSPMTAEPSSPPLLSAAPVPAPPPPAPSLLGEGSFFERRAVSTPAAPVQSATPCLAPAPDYQTASGSASGHRSSDTAGGEPEGGSVLDRFKKMPDLTRRGR